MAHVRELTPRGRGGVSVLELRGENSFEFLARHLEGARLAPGKLSLVRLELGGEALDEALVWCESTSRVELHLHGSPALVRRVETELVRAGFERWSPPVGPRSIEARALELLPTAVCEAGARMLLDQSEGTLRMELEFCNSLRGQEFCARLALLAERARLARYLLQPARIVLAGPVNAGKSTLFNALVGSERALVTPAPGTTRDVLCEPAHAGAWPLLVFDTAGERELSSRDLGEALEIEGQALGARARAGADLVLWLAPADGAACPAPAGSHALVTRADLAPAPREPHSARAAPRLAAGPDPIAAAGIVSMVIRQALELPERAWEAGAGVPFEPWMEPALRAAAQQGDASVLERLACDR